MRIIMIEDDPTHGIILTRLLTDRGHEVDVAPDLLSARTLLADKRYDVGAVDWILHEKLGGREGLRLLHGAGISRLVVTSACPVDMLKEEDWKAINECHAVWMPKPIRVSELLTAWGMSDHEVQAFAGVD